MFQCAVFVGSLRKNSFNKQLAYALEQMSKDLFSFKYIDLASIPLYNQDLEVAFPEPVTVMKDLITHSDAVLFFTPEYNRSVPGVLKNAIDWASRPYGKNAFAQKPVSIAGMSLGLAGTAVAQAHLRGILSMLNMVVMGFPEIQCVWKNGYFTDDGLIADEGSQKFFRSYLEKFFAWIEKHK